MSTLSRSVKPQLDDVAVSVRCRADWESSRHLVSNHQDSTRSPKCRSARLSDVLVIARELGVLGQSSSSGNVEESAESFADDLACGGVVCHGSCFDGGPQFRVDPHRHNISRS